MAPTRVGIVGLSRSSGWAPSAHLPYLKRSPDYEITAVCNSSVASAQNAIKEYELPASTAAYGNPEDLAKDANVDLVVCTVRVDRHFNTISPSLKAGKDVFVEWPLAKNLAEAEELLRLKNEFGAKKAVVGLQARQGPLIKQLKQLVDSKRIGDVLSSTWVGQGGLGGGVLPETYKAIAQRSIGANLVSIHFGHMIDYLQAVLGYGFTTGPKTVLANRRPTVKLISDDGSVILESLPKDIEDTIFLNGTLTSGIPLSVTFRGGPAFKGTPGVEWRIYGSTGEIRVTTAGLFLHIGEADTKIEVHDFDKDTVEVVKVDTDEFDATEGETYAWPAKNVGRIYQELAKGNVNCSFEDAVERHRLIDGIYKENGINI